MPLEAVFAAIAFAGLFTMWVVLPSKLRKQRSGSELVSQASERQDAE